MTPINAEPNPKGEQHAKRLPQPPGSRRGCFPALVFALFRSSAARADVRPRRHTGAENKLRGWRDLSKEPQP